MSWMAYCQFREHQRRLPFFDEQKQKDQSEAKPLALISYICNGNEGHLISGRRKEYSQELSGTYAFVIAVNSENAAVCGGSETRRDDFIRGN